MINNRTYFKSGFLGGLLLVFCIWLGWYTFHYLKIEKSEVQKTAVIGLNCPISQINIGPSYQFNDGPSEFPIEGCGKKRRVLCDDNGYRYGTLKQYFVVDLTCRLKNE